MTIQILATRALRPEQLALLHASAPDIAVRHLSARTGPQVEQALTPDVEVLLTIESEFSIAHATSLRWVQAETAGVDHFVGTPVWAGDVLLTSANGAHTPHMPEYVFAHILSRAYKLPLADWYQQQARWGGDGPERKRFTPRELRGQTIGIVGYGAIGREIARLATALGMRVLATRRSAGSPLAYGGYTPPGTGDPGGSLPEAYVTLDNLAELLGASDVVVLVLPLAAATRSLIGAAELARMKPDALLINIGRGGLIDQGALLAALERGAIGGAVLDVTDPEPLPPEHPLWRAPNLVITPHIAGLSAHYFDNVLRVFAENLRRYAQGQPLLNVVERELGY